MNQKTCLLVEKVPAHLPPHCKELLVPVIIDDPGAVIAIANRNDLAFEPLMVADPPVPNTPTNLLLGKVNVIPHRADYLWVFHGGFRHL